MKDESIEFQHRFYEHLIDVKTSINNKEFEGFCLTNPKIIEFIQPYKTRWELNDVQISIFFSVLVHEFSGMNIDKHGFCELFDKAPIDFIEIQRDINTLEAKQILISSGFSGENYRIHRELKKDVISGEVPNLVSFRCLSFQEFITKFKRRTVFHRNWNYSYRAVKNLVENNAHLEAYEFLEDYELSTIDLITFFYVLVRNMEQLRDVELSNLSELLPRSQVNNFILNINSGNSPLIKYKLLSFGEESGGFEKKATLALGDKAIHYFVTKGLVKLNPIQDKLITITDPSEIDPVNLYYNSENKKVIKRLQMILEEDRFNDFQKRAKENALSSGLTIMLSGEPGTGKTELVKQLARDTNRALVTINLSEVRDKWVGESEKRVATCFTYYTYKSKYEERKPILFFNEADAIFGNRITTKHSVDKMENSIQNILLDFLEKFDGILICTTNLLMNLDKAFDRRFLFKVNMEKPNESTRLKILTSLFPQLNEMQLKSIAQNYSLAGGDFANIRRKMIVDECLFGEISSANLLQYFGEEKQLNQTHVGFKRA